MKVDFCIPVKNEAEMLEKNILQLLNYLKLNSSGFDWRIVGAINGSSDESEIIFKNLKNNFPGIVEYFSMSQPGKGGAIKECWRQSQADILVFMDADLAVSLTATIDLLNPILKQESDLVIGSRFLPTATAQRSLQRGIISKSYAMLSRSVLGHHRTDIQCGFKAMSKSGFQKIEKFLFDNAWFFDTELVTLAELSGLKVSEIAVEWTDNRIGIKKSDIKIFKDSYKFLVKLLYFRYRLPNIKKCLKNV